jgi:predicted Holliday junction resolvase-like endonuclease
MIILALLVVIFLCFIAYKALNPVDTLAASLKAEVEALRTKEDALTRQVAKEEQVRSNMLQMLQLTQAKVEELEIALNKSKEATATVTSQKKSGEVKLGTIAENALGLLQGLPYDVTNLRHLGAPIDYVYFDYNKREIVFIEVKSGNAKESPRQKLIKQLVKQGQIYYEELRIDQNGVKIKRALNNE